MAALVHQNSHPTLIFSCSPRRICSNSSRASLLVRFKPFASSFSLSATPPTPHSHPSPAIFLPLLEQESEEPEEQPATEIQLLLNEGEDEEEEEDDDFEDPIVRFFKSRSSTKDPSHEGKFSLQSNRRTHWRLARDFDSEQESDLDDVPISQLLGSASVDARPLPEGVVGEVMKLARNLPQNATLGEQLSGYEGRISAKECVDLLGLMGDEGLMMGCLYFFEWMRLQEPSLITPRACTILFPLLGRSGMGDQMMVLFNNLLQNKEFRDVHVYNAAISGLLCCRRYEDACHVYEVMEVNNIRPDHVTCAIVITVMRRSGRSAKEVWGLFEKMNRIGVQWSSEVMGALVKSFCSEGLMKEALIIQSEMEEQGIPSNAIVYNTLMDAYVKSNQIEELEGLFAEMKAKGHKPTSATFNILMDAYSRRIQPEIVEKLLLEMEDAGLEPNVRSYTCLISAYGRKKKKSDMAANAFLRMKKVGIRPTSHSYTALIHAYSLDGWHEKAYIAFENMQREGVKPSVETYTALLDAFRRAGDTQTLMKIWRFMRREKVEGTRVTFNILLDGFAKQGHYIEARDVVSEFGNLGLPPTVMTYNMLMNAYARGGSHSKLPQLLKEMTTLGLKPDSFTYMTMIYAYVRVRDFRRAFFYHKQMVKTGQVPDVKTYEKLRAILNVKAATKNRKDKSAILGIAKSTMGLLKAKKRGKKDEFWKHKKKSFINRTIASNGQ